MRYADDVDSHTVTLLEHGYSIRIGWSSEPHSAAAGGQNESYAGPPNK